MSADGKDRREDVRGELDCTVKYKMISLAEYELLSNQIIRPSGFNVKKLKPGANRSDDMDTGLGLNDEVLHFLIRMDEKMNRILSLISKDEIYGGPFKEAVGRNISATGINIVIDHPVRTGQILQLSIILSKIPFIGIDAFAEILRTTPVIKEQDKSMWQLAMKFLRLDEAGREKIVAYVFQMQRRTIRKTKAAISPLSL